MAVPCWSTLLWLSPLARLWLAQSEQIPESLDV